MKNTGHTTSRLLLCTVGFAVLVGSLVYVRKSEVVSALTSQEASTYIYAAPTVNPSGVPPEIKKKINDQISRLLAAKHQAFRGARLWGTSNQLLWGHGHAVAALSRTYPFVEASIQPQLKTLLLGQVDTYLLSSSHIQTKEIAGNVGGKVLGNDEVKGLTFTGNGAFCWDALYGVWSYAHYTGDWAAISSRWDAIKAIYALCPANPSRIAGSSGTNVTGLPTSGLNNSINGLSAMARMAKRVNDQTMQYIAANAVLPLFEQKESQVTGLGNNPLRKFGSGDDQYIHMEGYYDMTPELGRFLEQRQKSLVQTQVNTVTNRYRTWFYGDYDHSSDWMSVPPFDPVTPTAEDEPGEEGFQSSYFGSHIFLAKAYVLKESGANLRKVIPMYQASMMVPWYTHMYNLEHLTAVASAYAQVTWSE